jgi:hypothetical protein
MGAAVQQRVAIHFLPQSFDPQCALADQVLFEQLAHRMRDQHPGAAAAVAKADALMAVGGAHPHQGVIARQHLARRERRGMVERDADGAGLDRHDARIVGVIVDLLLHLFSVDGFRQYYR